MSEVKDKVAAAIACQDIKPLIGDPKLHTETQCQLYLVGFSLRKIADLFAVNGVKITHETVRQNLIDSGIPLRGTVAPKPVTYRKVADKMSQIERLLRDGMTIDAIAKQLGLNPKTVSKVKKSLSSI